jgi:hypothetical protein
MHYGVTLDDEAGEGPRRYVDGYERPANEFRAVRL